MRVFTTEIVFGVRGRCDDRGGATALHQRGDRPPVYRYSCQSLVGFAFSHLLGFKLLPRMKNISKQKLARVDADEQVPVRLAAMTSKHVIDWELIAQQYDQMASP